MVPLSVACCTQQIANGGTKLMKMKSPTGYTPMMDLFRKQFQWKL